MMVLVWVDENHVAVVDFHLWMRISCLVEAKTCLLFSLVYPWFENEVGNYAAAADDDDDDWVMKVVDANYHIQQQP